MQIAIDGPSGAGKSTIAKKLSEKLNFEYLDTGAMYRAVALGLKEQNFSDFENSYELKKYLKNIKLNIIDNKIFLNGKDVTKEIRNEEIGMAASKVSSYKDVREYLVRIQREIAEDKNIIMDGRDVGTVILKDADYKIFLTAETKERAKRRYNQLKEKGKNPDINEIKKDIETRDYNDINRKYSPLKMAEDGIKVDCTNLSIEETVDKILNIINNGD